MTPDNHHTFSHIDGKSYLDDVEIVSDESQEPTAFPHYVHGNYVLIKPDAKEQVNETASGLVTVDFSQKKTPQGTIVAVGDGDETYTDCLFRIEGGAGETTESTERVNRFAPGQRVVYRPSAGFEVGLDGDVYLAVNVAEIIVTVAA